MSMAALVVVCLAVLVCSQRLEADSQASKTHPAAHPSSVSHADAGSDGHHKKLVYLSVPVAEEAEAGGEQPVNEKRLTALLLVAFIGAALGTLLGGKLLLRRSGLSMQPNGRRFLPSFDCPSLQRPAALLLSVFRL